MLLTFLQASRDSQHTATSRSASSTMCRSTGQWDFWLGDWTLTGSAKDSATEPEYKLV